MIRASNNIKPGQQGIIRIQGLIQFTEGLKVEHLISSQVQFQLMSRTKQTFIHNKIIHRKW